MSQLATMVIHGRLGADPEAFTFPGGGGGVRLRVAVNETWKKKDTGEKQERTDWFGVDCLGPKGDFVARFFKKGDPIIVVGRPRMDQYQDKDGNNRSAFKLVARDVHFCGGKKSEGDNDGDGFAGF